MDDQDPAMILAVVRRLHEDQGDTNLHTVIRAARFLDIDIAIDLINEIFNETGIGSADVCNEEGISPKDLCTSGDQIPARIIASVLDPLGANHASAAMDLLQMLSPQEPKAPIAATSATTLPIPTTRPETTTTPTKISTTAPISPILPSPNSSTNSSTISNSKLSSWLIVGSRADTSASEYWFHLIQEDIQSNTTTTTNTTNTINNSRIAWFQNPDSKHSEGHIDINTISSMSLPNDDVANNSNNSNNSNSNSSGTTNINCEIHLVYHAQNICLTAATPAIAQNWSNALQDLVFDCGAPPSCLITSAQDAFNLMRRKNVNEEAVADDLNEFLLNVSTTNKSNESNAETTKNYVRRQKDTVSNERLLDQAASSGYVDVAEVLLTHGADMTMLNDDGNNALHLVCSRSTAETLQRLVELSSATSATNLLEIPNKLGETCMHVAAGAGNATVLETLVNYGVDVYAVDLRKRTG